ncbi:MULTISPECIES: YgjV family protein [unclassified Agarivorans]|uniref:YgjV family protein n=1 Tax=unclassified Agarivorans TaxID=2636026 RepID=UPI003D7D6459
MPELNLAQVVGLIAFLIGISAFFTQDGHAFRRRLTIFQIVLCGHFILMGAYTAVFASAISALRTYASSKTQSSGVMWSFIALLWLMSVLAMHNPYELLPIIGTSLATWGLFKTEGLKLRALLLFNSFCWLGNNLLLGSIGGTMMETTFILVNSYTIINLIRANNKQAIE